MRFDWNKAIDWIQFGMLWFVIGVLIICVAVLILFDVLAGAGIMIYLTNGNVPVSFFISVATSGLLLALMVLGYSASNQKNFLEIGKLVLFIAFLVYILDIYFDSLTADYLRFGQIIILKEIPNSNVHLMFRSLIGGISTVGEALAMSIIVGMPVLKAIINKAVPESMRQAPVTPRKENVIPEYEQKAQFRQNDVHNQQRTQNQPQVRQNPPKQSYPEPTYHKISMQASQDVEPVYQANAMQSKRPDTPPFLANRQNGERQ